MNPLFKNLGKDLMTFGRQRLMDAASDVTEAGLDNVPQGTNVNYVRVIGSDGESYKIEKEAFMGLIRDALPAVLSNLNGNIAQVFGKVANGGMGYETVQSLASVLGVNAILYKENFGTNLTSAVLTKRGLRQAILMVTQNGPTRTPSIYVLKRTSIYHTICEGEIKAADISIDSTTGYITIAKNEGLTMYTRTILLEA